MSGLVPVPPFPEPEPPIPEPEPLVPEPATSLEITNYLLGERRREKKW